jgi:2TM domain
MNDEEIRVGAPSEQDLRKEAVVSIKRKRAFKQTAITYVLVNALLIVIWAVSGAGFFWPAFVLGGWGIGLCFQGWDAYRRRRGISEDEVAQEMQRLRG